ncbi:MAG: SRPBCC family protein [Deltaproteobacteria bacterium]|nr:SRPBCC family protein [Deltaproteobacteria bacterium]
MVERRGSGSLVVTLPSDKEILMTRVFDAPRRLVFEAMTKVEYVRQWWVCMGELAMPVCEIDFRVGGRYRYVTRMPDGSEFAFHGEYREIVPPERIVHTEIFEPYPEELTVCTVTLVEKDGKTHYRCLVVHTTKEGRDAHVASGMESGADMAFDKVESIARELASRSPALAG